MNTTEFERWIEMVRRRPLSPAEQSQLEDFLSRHPDKREVWAEETALTRLLVTLPDPPLSSHFTARVLEATAAPATHWRPVDFVLRWLPRPALGLAVASFALLLGAAGFLLEQERAQTRLATSVADVSRQIELAASATDLPVVQLLQDFDAIYRLSQPQSLPDEELLAALQ
jgi:ferric-dicitrate binding protein FerR (iron transport regulator)